MRITNSILYQTVKRSVQNSAQDVQKYQEQLSSGKRVNRPSDDPLGAMRSQQLYNRLSRTGQYQRNGTYAKSWLNMTETSLSQASNILIRLKELAVAQASDQYENSDRVGAAREVETIRDELLGIANTKLGGRSIFAGHKTTDPAFNLAGQYMGSDGKIRLNIDEKVSLEVNAIGEEVFRSGEDKNIFDTLNEFSLALENGDVAAIQSVIDELETAFTNVNSSVSQIGSRNKALEHMESVHEDRNIIDKEQLGKVEEIDVVETVVNMQSAQNAFQASLMASGQIGKLSLAQFI